MKLTKKNWSIVRTILFLIIGLLNTLFIRPEDIGTWKNYVGYGFLFLAVLNALLLVNLHLKKDNNNN